MTDSNNFNFRLFCFFFGKNTKNTKKHQNIRKTTKEKKVVKNKRGEPPYSNYNVAKTIKRH